MRDIEIRDDPATLGRWCGEYAARILEVWPAEGEDHRRARAELFERERSEQVETVSLILETCRPQAGSACLDVGPAFGFKPYLLSRLGVEQTALEHSGVDFGAPMEELFPFPIRQCDLARDVFPFADASFDLVTATGLVEHIPGPTSHFWRELVRVLRPGGRLFVLTPNAASLRNRLLALGGRTTGLQLPDWFGEPGGVFTGHWREHTLADLLWIGSRLGTRTLAHGYTETFWWHSWHRYRHSKPKRAALLVYRALSRLVPGSKDCVYVVFEKP